MEFLFELGASYFGELLLQFVFELLFRLGWRLLVLPFRRRRHPLLAALGIGIWGALAGALSLLIVPASMIRDPMLRLTALAVVPVVIGGSMALIGRRRKRRGRAELALDRFSEAAAFAFAMQVVRFWFAR